MKRPVVFLAQGWLVWALALGGVLALPGLAWRAARPPEFPWEMLPATLLLLLGLAAGALALVWQAGPRLARSRLLALWEAPPELLWGGLALALWPASWGPPGRGAWALAFLLAALPTEVRWLAQALPGEHPFPWVWGPAAVRRLRGLALKNLAPRWLAARLPLWLTATLVLERMLGVRGLGSDWMARVSAQDRHGLILWVLLYGLVWTLAQRTEARA